MGALFAAGTTLDERGVATIRQYLRNQAFEDPEYYSRLLQPGRFHRAHRKAQLRDAVSFAAKARYALDLLSVYDRFHKTSHAADAALEFLSRVEPAGYSPEVASLLIAIQYKLDDDPDPGITNFRFTRYVDLLSDSPSRMRCFLEYPNANLDFLRHLTGSIDDHPSLVRIERLADAAIERHRRMTTGPPTPPAGDNRWENPRFAANKLGYVARDVLDYAEAHEDELSPMTLRRLRLKYLPVIEEARRLENR